MIRLLQYAFLAIIVTTVGFSLYQWNASRASTQKTAPGNGLVGYWSFDENTGTQAGDASGNGNTGTFVNSPTWGTGKFGSAVNFNGSTNYVSIPDSSSLNPSLISISAWIYYVSQSGSGGGAIVSKYDNSGTSRSYLVDIAPGTEAIGALVSSSGSSGTIFHDDTLGAVPKNKWSHVVMTYDGSNVYLYLNGVKSTTNMPYTGNLFDNTTVLSIGARPQGSTGYFGGKVDEVRIYNRALSGTEVTNLYNLGAEKLNVSPTASLTSGLVGYWTFDGKDTPWTSSSAGTATDRSGNGNTGTLTNMSRATSPIEGKIGQALNFDGTDDRVTVSSDVIGSGATSICAWVNPRSMGGGGFGRIVESSDGGGTGKTVLAMQTGPRIGLVSDGATNLITVNTISYNTWVHTCATRDASGSSIIYINGVRETSGSSGTPSSGATKLDIGNRAFADRTFDGFIDDVRIYNRQISATEVQSLYDLGASDKVNSSVSQNQGVGRLDSGLVGYWKLDDNTGTTATDSSTNGNNGTLTNGPTWGTGRIGSDVVFDGVNDYITIPDSPLYTKNALSVSFWTNITNISGQARALVNKASGGSRSWNILVNTSGGIEFSTASSSSDYNGNYGLSSAGGIVANQWAYVTAVYNGPGGTNADRMKIYINGVSQSITFAGTIPASLVDNSDVIALGYANGDYGASVLPGQLDEVRVYNRALSADEVSQLYRLTAPTGVDTSLKGYWSFNGPDISGTTAYDRSGAGNNGTLTNGPTITEGKLGQALNFDGSNQSVSASYVPTPSAYTYCLWIKSPTAPNTSSVSQPLNYGNDSFQFSWNHTNSAYEQAVSQQDSSGTYYAAKLTSTLLANTWYFICGRWDGANLTAWLNAQQQATVAVGSIHSQSGNLFIARGIGPSQYFPGQIDEPRIYNRALSATEVAALYNSGR